MKKNKDKEEREPNIYNVWRKENPLFRIQIEAEFFEVEENGIAKFYDENSVMIAAMKVWESVEIEGKEDDSKDLPPNFGKVNGEKF